MKEKKWNDYIMKRLLTVFALVLGTMLMFEYASLEERQRKHDFTMETLYQDKADFLFDYIGTKTVEAQRSALFVKNQILNEFDREFKGREDELMKELDSILNGNGETSYALEIIGRVLEGYSLNNISGNAKDNNDPVIFLVNLIIGDLSLNCATDQRTRTIEVEKKQQFASNLAEKAMIDITKRGKTVTYWHFLPLTPDVEWYHEVKNFNSTELHDLKDLYLKYKVNDEVLKNFEILVTERLNTTTDYFGNKVISASGVFSEKHYQFHIVQGFNIYDQLNLNPADKAELYEYNYRIQAETRDFISYKAQMHLKIAVTFAVFILLFMYVEKKR